MKTMGGETMHILPWCVHLIDKYGGKMPTPEPLKRACQTLIRHVRLLKACPIRPVRSYCQELLDTALDFLDYTKESGTEFLPKHHFWLEMVRKVQKTGPPYELACFLDESLNLHAANAAAAVHKTNWEVRFFERISLHAQYGEGQASFLHRVL